jgi:nicotinamide-nucleotide amidase
LAVSTVGVAGPGDLGPDLPAGLVYAAVASEVGVQSFSFSWSGTRKEIRSRTAKFALNRVRLHLLRANPGC